MITKKILVVKMTNNKSCTKKQRFRQKSGERATRANRQLHAKEDLRPEDRYYS